VRPLAPHQPRRGSPAPAGPGALWQLAAGRAVTPRPLPHSRTRHGMRSSTEMTPDLEPTGPWRALGARRPWGVNGNSRSSRAATASAEHATTYRGDGSKEGARRCPDPVATVGEGAGGRRSRRRRLRFASGRHGRERWRSFSLVCIH
jgi:hypothetical protein